MQLIQKLKEKAVVEYPMGFDGVKYVFSPELFAKLIIEECAELLEKQHTWISNVAASSLIRSHFNIEPPKSIPDGIDLNDPSWRKILGLDRRVLEGKELAHIRAKMWETFPVNTFNNQRSVTEVFHIDGKKYHLSYFEGYEEIVEEIL